MKEIDDKLYAKLKYLGIINDNDNNVRSHNIGKSNYADHTVQPYSIWIDWNLNPWDADIVKRALRTKDDTPRREDYEKIIHICQERIRQIDTADQIKIDEIDFTAVD